MSDQMNEKDSGVSESPLAEAIGFTPQMLALLSDKWITTSEGFISAAATPEGHEGICRLLSCSEVALDALLDEAARGLPPERVAILKTPVPPHAMGMLIPDAGGMNVDALDRGGQNS